ncbi:MAG: phospholipid carrier-dependent glycosyltransferase [Acidimicrobiales bacterium]
MVSVGALGVALLAIGMRAMWLGYPRIFVFDEIFYANDAVDLIEHGVEGGSPVHPPLGKWMLAAGIKVVGLSAVGWRIVPLLAGAAVVALTWIIGWEVTGRRRGAAVASAFVLFDGISVVTGRLALLDGLVALWTTLALLLLVRMADQPLDREAQRRSRLWLGVVLGLALATKWTAVVLVPVVLVAVVAIDQYLPRPVRWRRSLGSLVLMGALVFGVYALVYVPWLVNYEDSAAVDDSCAPDCDAGLVERVGDIAAHQVEVWDYHRQLQPQQRDAASAVYWFGQTKAVRLLVKSCEPDLADFREQSDDLCRSETLTEIRILSVGNPVVWVVGPVAMLAMIVVGWRRRDGPVLVVAGAAVMFWLPWLIGGRPGFTFYAAPLVPALGVLTAAAIERLPARVARWWPGLVVVVAAVAIAMWPLWIGLALAPETADRLLWFSGWR